MNARLVPVIAHVPVLLLAMVAGRVLPTPRSAVGDTAGGADDASMIYQRDCASCHGPDARGTSKGPDLAGQGAAGIDFVLSTGRMPPAADGTIARRAPTYPAATEAALVAHVAALVPGGPPVPVVEGGDVSRGGAIYRAQCAACHQAAGEGGALVGQAESPSLRAATPVQIAEAVRTGPGTMPVFGTSAVPDRDLASLVRYVVALQHPADPGGQPLWHLGPLPEGMVAFAACAVLILALRRIGARA